MFCWVRHALEQYNQFSVGIYSHLIEFLEIAKIFGNDNLWSYQEKTRKILAILNKCKKITKQEQGGKHSEAEK